MKEALTIKKLFKFFFFALLKTEEEVRVVEGRGKANFLTRLQPRKTSWSSKPHIQKSEMFPVTSQRTKEEKLCVCKPVDFFKYIPKNQERNLRPIVMYRVSRQVLGRVLQYSKICMTNAKESIQDHLGH